ncbi:hypothetical protein AC578_5836 [Pseudocercospora eumusae]|uniref:Uncharacterized protein n=1 Tax=Pseudocercospora eumusae TaxID=321146 RepID=A0A139H248_9PEZI|nr:hypothetical protein AC578_5836 [Pseudocercospora eumusae]
MSRHLAQSLLLGTLPMGLATIINMVVFVCVPKVAGEFWKLAWWIDAAILLACCLYLPFILYSLIPSYVPWATGVPLAMAVIVIYSKNNSQSPTKRTRRIILPPEPLGQSGIGIMQLEKVALRIFASKKTPLSEVCGLYAGQILYIQYVLGFPHRNRNVGFQSTFAIATITRSQRFPFNMVSRFRQVSTLSVRRN